MTAARAVSSHYHTSLFYILASFTYVYNYSNGWQLCHATLKYVRAAIICMSFLFIYFVR